MYFPAAICNPRTVWGYLSLYLSLFLFNSFGSVTGAWMPKHPLLPDSSSLYVDERTGRWPRSRALKLVGLSRIEVPIPWKENELPACGYSSKLGSSPTMSMQHSILLRRVAHPGFRSTVESHVKFSAALGVWLSIVATHDASFFLGFLQPKSGIGSHSCQCNSGPCVLNKLRQIT